MSCVAAVFRMFSRGSARHHLHGGLEQGWNSPKWRLTSVGVGQRTFFSFCGLVRMFSFSRQMLQYLPDCMVFFQFNHSRRVVSEDFRSPKFNDDDPVQVA